MSNDHILKLVKENEPFHDIAAKKYPGPKEFVHLHNHTLYSPLDGIASPEEYMCACDYFDHPGFAITDHGSLGAVPDAHFASQKHGVKYMVGIEIYFNDYHKEMREFTGNGGKLKDLKEEDPELVDRYRRNRHLTVIAKNRAGVKNLFHLTSQAWKIGFYYKPRIWMDQLLKYKEGLVILSGCLNGPVCHELRMAKKKLDENLPGAAGEASRHNRIAINYIKKFREEFGDDFYLELQMPGEEIENGKYCFKMISALSEKMGIPAVVTNDCLSHGFPVLMADGTYKPINEIRIGDEVITHLGRSRKVIATGSRSIKPNEKMWKCNNIPWSMTDNHPLYIEDNDINNRASDNPTMGRIGFVNLPKTGVQEIDTKKYVNPKRGTKLVDGFWRTASPKSKEVNIPEFIKLDHDFLWIIGNYIAEGYIDSYRLSFASNKCESETHRRVVDYFRQFGLNPNYNEKRTNSENGAVIRICSTIFANILSEMCGKLAHNKRLPDFWTSLDRDQIQSVLAGYIDGDGSIRNRSFSFASTSYQLAGQLMTLIGSIGGYSRPYYKEEKEYANGRVDREQFHGRVGQLAAAIINESEIPTNHTALGVYDNENMRMPLKWQNDDYDGLVYDIEVEEDHSFILWGNIVSRNCHYLNREAFHTQKAMMAVGQDTHIHDPNLFHVNSDEQFFKTRAQMRKTFYEGGYDKWVDPAKFEEYCDNTLGIMDSCDYFEPDMSPKLPEIPEADVVLRMKIYDALRDRDLLHNEKRYYIDGRQVTYKEQAEIELERLNDKKFDSYFLITEDLINYSRYQLNKDVGPARGSAGGSLVCFLLGITNLDPLKWGLSFDRFLSVSRGGYMLKATMD